MTEPSLRTPLLLVALCTGLLLLVPLIAMQFTAEVDWSPGDFLVAGCLLFGSGALIVLGLRRIKTWTGRLLLVAAVTMALLVTWAELAVGIFS